MNHRGYLIESLRKKLSEVIDHLVGAMRCQLFRVALPGDADHEPESALSARSDAGDRVLDHHGTLRRHPEHFGSLQKGIGLRLAGKTLLDQHIAINACVEKIVDFRRPENRLAILARGHHRGFDADPSQKLEEGDRAWVSLDAGRRDNDDEGDEHTEHDDADYPEDRRADRRRDGTGEG
jgi:hypothetical protein